MKIWVFFALLSSVAASAARDLSEKMLTFPQESNTAHVTLHTSQQNFGAATVCLRFFTDLRRSQSLFSLATPTVTNDIFLLYEVNPDRLSVHIRDVKREFKNIDFPFNKWNSVCLTWDSSSGMVQVWWNGQALTRKYIADSPVTGQPIIILGQDQDTYGGGFDIQQSFVGMMTDVHMWDYVLSPCEIQKYMEHRSYTPGNVINWAAVDESITGQVLVEDKQSCKMCPCT